MDRSEKREDDVILGQTKRVWACMGLMPSPLHPGGRMHVMQEARNGMIRLGGVHALFWNRIDITSWRLLLIPSNTDHLTYAAEKRVIMHIRAKQ